MKRFKTFSNEENIKDFEEDLVVEKAPDTSDAMKRYKSGKAGFGDVTHLKAKGLIPRADGTKRKSDKYK
jgi:predicted nucleic-acid-binding protein